MLILTLKAGVGGVSITERGELAMLPGGALLGEGGEGAEDRLRQDRVHVHLLEREHLHRARTAHEHRRAPSLAALRTLGLQRRERRHVAHHCARPQLRQHDRH
jgi:hypothetical protein